ncbi:hypothetical protein EBR96_03575 [bacterium]|nr:hypothetical protein [bacterium]
MDCFRIKSGIIALAAALAAFTPLYAQTEPSANLISAEVPRTITIAERQSALIYFPPNFDNTKRYPFIMALHGLRQTPIDAYKVWQPVAKSMGYILICPSADSFEAGYSRGPKDERERFVWFREYLDKTYRVDTSTSILVGFSRGGNLALETGILYPRKFRNVVSVFGFYNTGLDDRLKKQYRSGELRKSFFYLVTGGGDQTQNSMTWFNDQLDEMGISTVLKVYPDLYHNYPKDMTAFMSAIKTKIDERVKKEQE